MVKKQREYKDFRPRKLSDIYTYIYYRYPACFKSMTISRMCKEISKSKSVRIILIGRFIHLFREIYILVLCSPLYTST